MSNNARELEVIIEAHADLAKVALQILMDERFDPATRAPVLAACRYGFEDLDLIHDKIDLYGLVDDLFVLGIGVDQFLTAAGAEAAKFAQTKLDGVPAGEMVARMKALNQGSFWNFCRDTTAEFFMQCARTLAGDKAFMEDTRDRFTLEMWNLSKETTSVKGQLSVEEVQRFLDYYGPGVV
ncbi:MAG: hypothetical protein ACYS22_15795 [Planctomycetota bacterium]|jgi:uncharacterized membrane protein YkvA (DUF1232 family)